MYSSLQISWQSAACLVYSEVLSIVNSGKSIVYWCPLDIWFRREGAVIKCWWDWYTEIQNIQHPFIADWPWLKINMIKTYWNFSLNWILWSGYHLLWIFNWSYVLINLCEVTDTFIHTHTFYHPNLMFKCLVPLWLFIHMIIPFSLPNKVLQHISSL